MHIANLYALLQEYTSSASYIITSQKPHQSGSMTGYSGYSPKYDQRLRTFAPKFDKMNKKMANKSIEFICYSTILLPRELEYCKYGNDNCYSYCMGIYNDIDVLSAFQSYFNCRIKPSWEAVKISLQTQIREIWIEIETLQRAKGIRSSNNKQVLLSRMRATLSDLRNNFSDRCREEYLKQKSRALNVSLHAISWDQTKRLYQLRSGAEATIQELTTPGFGGIVKAVQNKTVPARVSSREWVHFGPPFTRPRTRLLFSFPIARQFSPF